jgi:signal transduction histidine kinase
MQPYLTALSIMAGVCLGFGIIFLFIGLRRRGTDMVQFTFGLFAVAYGGAVLTGLLMYGADTLPQYLAVSRWSGAFAGITYIFLIWFVATYTDVQPLPLLAVLTVMFATLVAAHVSRPTGIHGEILGLAFATLPWGEQIAFLDAGESAWELVFLLTQLLTIGFLFYACIRQYRRGERGKAQALGAGLLLFVAALVIDVLVESGVVNFVLTSDFGFLPLALVMSLRLAGEVIRAEEELSLYRERLELLVDERTADLQRANDQLAREVDDRMQVEEELKLVASERGQRVKELNCLFGISDLAGRQDVTLDEILQGTAELIPPAWQDPNATAARIVLEDREFKTERFQETPSRLASDFVVGGQPAGTVEVRLLEGKEPQHGSPFLPEERRLLEVITERLGRIVERIRTEEALRLRVEELVALNRIAHTMATATDLPTTLQQVSEMVTDLFAARYAHVIWSEDLGGENALRVGYEPGSGHTGPAPLDLSLSELPVVCQVLQESRPRIIGDVGSLTLHGDVREFLEQRSVESVLLVPLIIRRAAIGVMSVASDLPGRVFSADDVRLAETIATDLAGAIENARLFDQAQETAISAERSRLARELHDSVTQILFSINLIALSLGRLWKRNPEMAARSTDELQRLTRGALAEMRALLRELRPQTIAATKLSTLLKQLGDGIAARHDIPLDVEVGQPCELPPEVHVALYRIAQEALSNVAKHAEASQVAVKLACEDAATQLTITDNGQGFDPDEVPAEHMGLDIMRERVDAIGAAMTITSQPGAGTSIVVTWPIPQTGGDSHAKS